MWGKGVCDIWEKWVVWVEKSKTLLQKKNAILRCGEKGCATYGRNGLSGWRHQMHLLTESVLSLAEGYHR